MDLSSSMIAPSWHIVLLYYYGVNCASRLSWKIVNQWEGCLFISGFLKTLPNGFLRRCVAVLSLQTAFCATHRNNQQGWLQLERPLTNFRWIIRKCKSWQLTAWRTVQNTEAASGKLLFYREAIRRRTGYIVNAVSILWAIIISAPLYCLLADFLVNTSHSEYILYIDYRCEV